MNTSKKKQRMSKEDRREDILEKSLEVFIDKGYTRATTAELAKNAGITEVTLFRYFSSKQEIFLEAIRPFTFDKLYEMIESPNHLFTQEKIETTLFEIIKSISKNSDKGKLLLMETSTLIEWEEETIIERVTSILKELIKKMGVSQENEDLVLRLLMGSYLSFLFKPEADDEKMKIYAKNLVEYILPLLQAPTNK